MDEKEKNNYGEWSPSSCREEEDVGGLDDVGNNKEGGDNIDKDRRQ